MTYQVLISQSPESLAARRIADLESEVARLTTDVEEAKKEGYNSGYEDGLNDGWDNGYDAAQED